MTFEVAAESYARFMGRYSLSLAEALLDRCPPLAPGARALDVGCGPGVLTGLLVDRLGPGAVSALDPSATFVAAARERLPGVDVREGTADPLPYDDDTFDASLANLVVNFMPDPVAGLAEMGRVTRAGGTVAATVWDFGGERAPLSLFWSAAMELDPAAGGESGDPGTCAGQLADLATRAGLVDPVEVDLVVRSAYATFEEWWEPYTLGVGPAGAHLQRLDEGRREELRALCAERLPPAPFEVTAAAWCVLATC